MVLLEKTAVKSDLDLYIEKSGFGHWDMGGSSEAYVKKLKNDSYIILTDSEGLNLPASKDIRVSVVPSIGEPEDISYPVKSLTALKKTLPTVISTLEHVPAEDQKGYQAAIKALKNKVINKHNER